MPSPAVVALLVAALGVGAQTAAGARPLSADRLTPAKGEPEVYLIDGRFQRGAGRLARMRRDGELPDTIRRSGCRFDLAGDVGVAYYVRTCP